MKRFALLLLLSLLGMPAYARGIVAVPPAPTLPVYGQTIQVPARATYNADCVGVSEAGIAGCTTRYTWKPLVGRFKPPQYRSLATTYEVSTGAVVALRPLPGDTDTIVNGVTPGGRVWGQSLYGLAISRAVEWDSTGAPTYLGVAKADAADDLGRFAVANQLCTVSGCVTVPNVYKIHALSNTDYVASYISEGGHYSMCRASDYAAAIDAEDLCSEFYLSEFGVPPTRVAANAVGTVVYHNTYGAVTLGVVSQPGQTLQEFANYWGVPFAAVNELGDAVGGNKILRADGLVETIPLGPYALVSGLGINSAGVVVGQAKLGTQWRAVVSVP